MGRNHPKVQYREDPLHGVQKKRKGRRKNKPRGRPRGAKNKNEERTYTNAQLLECIAMDIDREKNPRNQQYKSWREQCRAMGVPEATVRLNRKKIKLKVPIITNTLSLTGQRLLAEAEEKILVNVILDAQERGVCVTRINIKQMVMDFLMYQRKIEDGEILEDDVPTLLARLKSHDSINDMNHRHQKWFIGFKRRNPSVHCKKPEYLSRKRGKVTEGQIRNWFKDRLAYFKDKNLMSVLNNPDCVFNFDETNINFSPSIPSVLTVVGHKTTKHAFLVTAGQTDKGSVTALIMASASGNSPPPTPNVDT